MNLLKNQLNLIFVKIKLFNMQSFSLDIIDEHLQNGSVGDYFHSIFDFTKLLDKLNIKNILHTMTM